MVLHNEGGLTTRVIDVADPVFGHVYRHMFMSMCVNVCVYMCIDM